MLQSRQHTVRPVFRFHPIPSCADFSRLFSRCRHCREFVFRSSVQSVFHLPASLRSAPRCGASSSFSRTCCLLPLSSAEVSLIHVPGLPAILSPTTAVTTVALAPLSAVGFFLAEVWASPYPCRLATNTGRIEFVILRTGSSLPVAPHLVSRRRNNSSLQAGERMPEEDFHLSSQVHFAGTDRSAVP